MSLARKKPRRTVQYSTVVLYPKEARSHLHKGTCLYRTHLPHGTTNTVHTVRSLYDQIIIIISVEGGTQQRTPHIFNSNTMKSILRMQRRVFRTSTNNLLCRIGSSRPAMEASTACFDMKTFADTAMRPFHSTDPLWMPVRRRRRARQTEAEEKSDGTVENPLKHQPVEDTLVFCHEASALLTKLQKALEPMKALNDTFIVKRVDGDIGEILTIDLGPKEGCYRIEISEMERMFEYTSPISGKLLYVLSAETKEWVGIEDGHLFEGLIVRDLLRQCRGMPKL